MERMWGKLLPAPASLRIGALPIGLAHNVKLKRDRGRGDVVCWDDVEIDQSNDIVTIRRAMEARFDAQTDA
jgi:predicted homoserine dehydrogenase-like protein